MRVVTACAATTCSIRRESTVKSGIARSSAIIAGAILLAAILLEAIRPDPVALIAAITAVIGGIVLFGSNTSTLQQAAAAVRSAEAERAALIGRMQLRVVEQGALTTTLH